MVYIVLIGLGDLGLLVVTVMNENAITKFQLLALLYGPASVLLPDRYRTPCQPKGFAASRP